MKVLFVVPEIRIDSGPMHFPFWAGILAAIVEKKGGNVGILDLNSLRMNFDGKEFSDEMIEEEVSREDWDLIAIGGLTSTYKRIKELTPIIRKASPESLLVAGGGWSSYNPDEILKLVTEIDMICIGEGEETFSEIYDQIESGQRDFDKVAGLCIRDNGGFRFTEPRLSLIHI